MFDYVGDPDDCPEHRRVNGAEHFDLVCSDNGGGCKKARVTLIQKENCKHMLEIRRVNYESGCLSSLLILMC